MMRKERLLLYAQGYEDLVIYHVLKEIKGGFYVDVGANSPWDGSVTKLFYERGWHGINIEPLEEMYCALCEDRSRDLNICVGIGSKETVLPLAVNQGCSSFEPEVVSQMERAGNVVERRSVRLRRLDSVLDELLIQSSQPIHFLKIDVEGFEREVLDGLSLDKYRPWIIALESVDPVTRISNYPKWESILAANGYVFVYEQFVNRYYVASERQELKDRFIGVDALINKYDLYFVSHTSCRALESAPLAWMFKAICMEVLSRIKRRLPIDGKRAPQ